MKNLLLLFVAFFLIQFGNVAQQTNNLPNNPYADKNKYDIFSTGVDTAWVRHYASGMLSGSDYPSAVAVDNDGNFFVTGNSGTIKYNPLGVEQWVIQESGITLAVDASNNVFTTGNGQTVKYNSSGILLWSVEKEGIDIAVDVSGNVFITNTIDGDYSTTKFNNDGVEQWEAIYDTPGYRNSVVGLALDNSGNVYVTGSIAYHPIRGTAGYYEGFGTIKYDILGNEKWVMLYKEPSDSIDHSASDIIVDQTGNVYITGSIENDETGRDYVTVQYDSSGIEQWVVSYNGFGDSWDVPEALCVDNSGNVYVTGSTVTIKYNASGVEQWIVEEGGIDLDIDHLDYIYLMSYNNDNYEISKFSSSGIEQWVVYYDGPANGNDIPVALTLDDEGNVLVTGSSEGAGTESDYVTVKYNYLGEKQCLSRYSTAGFSMDFAEDIAVDEYGNVFVTGISRSPNSDNDFVTIKYNSTGDEIWRTRYNGPDNNSEFAAKLALDLWGNLFVAGNISTGIEGTYDIATIKYNSNGELLWVKFYTGSTSSFDEAAAIATDASGNVYIFGSSDGLSGSKDFITIKYSADGVEEWVAVYDGPANGYDEAMDIAVDDSGNVYVIGSAQNINTGEDYVTIKYNSYGKEQWVAFYSGSAQIGDYPKAIALDGKGNVFVTGSSVETITRIDYATIKYNSSGEEQWIVLYDGGGTKDRANDIALDNFGNVYVTGYSRKDPTGADYVTIKYSSEGDKLWEARYDVWLGGIGYSNERPYAIVVDSDGNAYVTGSSNGTNDLHHYDYATIKYNASGEEQWVTRYDGGEPAAIVVDGSNNVYVTGSTFDRYTTIKYIQAPVSVENSKTIAPKEYSLSQNYPNPFNPSTQIKYSVPQTSQVQIKVYDVLGNEVETLVNEEKPAGTYELTWNAANLPSGVYFYQLRAGDFVQTKKMILLK